MLHGTDVQKYIYIYFACAIGHFTTEPHINEGTVAHRRIMRGTLYWSHLYIVVRKGSPYTERFRELVSRIRDAGLPLHWEAAVIRNYMSERLQLQIVTSRLLNTKTEPTKLNLNELQGAFFLLILGEALAVISFFAELTFGKKPKSLGIARRGQYFWHVRSAIAPRSALVNSLQTKHREF